MDASSNNPEKGSRRPKDPVPPGRCEHCGAEFSYRLIHNGFNESAYAYCDRCGTTAILDTHYRDRPGIPRHRRIDASGEPLLQRCPCGGAFRADAGPRCPHCLQPLSAESARSYLERNAPGTALGWKWQGGWGGLYCIVIDEKCVRNNWTPEAAGAQ